MNIGRAKTIPLVLILLVSLGLAGKPAATYASDINNDGFDDLIVGVPEEDLPFAPNAGKLNIIFGSKSTGISTAGDQYFEQTWTGDPAEANDQFGFSIAAGDFNADGYYDLAVGAPFEGIGDPVVDRAGVVHVMYGSSIGVIVMESQLLHQGLGLIQDVPEWGDHFGYSLAAGDFNADGYADLAIGVPGENDEDVIDVGIVQVLWGSPTGIIDEANQRWNQGILLGEGEMEAYDQFGYALIAADFNGDGHADLAVSSPQETLFESSGPVPAGGKVDVMFGSGVGFTGAGTQTLNQPKMAAGDAASEVNDRFGEKLAAGDFNGDGYQDLVVGVPSEDIGGLENAGAANLFYGGQGGLRTGSGEFFTRNTIVADSARSLDGFAAALASGDFDGDGCDELAVSVPGADLLSLIDIGVVYIAPGRPDGLDLTSWDAFSQVYNFYSDSPAEEYDLLGTSLAAGNFNGDRYVDLAIGVPYEDSDNLPVLNNSGALHIVFGSPKGLTDVNARFIQEGVDGMGDECEQDNRYGLVLTAVPHQNFLVFLPITTR